MLAALVNGVETRDPQHAIAVNDRGLQYGDGVFETALLCDGRVRFLDDHMERLTLGCRRLGIEPQDSAVLADLESIRTRVAQGVLKIVVTRGAGERGYRPSSPSQPTRVVTVHALPDIGNTAVRARWCTTRLARNAHLAGIKHLNRLEQVLAQSEWHDERVHEGLMLDTEDELICATAANVFLVRDGTLVTPDLRFCGVRGVMRKQVIRAAASLGITASEEALRADDVREASEVFLTNAVRGIRPLVELDTLRWTAGPVAARLAAALSL